MPKTSPASRPATRIRPLLVREGARFTCHGDGLCCSDAHALGPLTRAERAHVTRFRADAAVYLPLLKDWAFNTREGGCVFLDRNARCTIHAQHGPEQKPAACNRFPYGLIATPVGGRVTTEHRCPCRTLGERPPLDLADAERSLAAGHARVTVEGRVPERVALTGRRRVKFETYLAYERPILARLLAGEDPLDVLRAAPLPALDGRRWLDAAVELRAERDGTSCGEATAMFGDVLLELVEDRKLPVRERPWAKWFDRAARRAEGAPRAAEELLSDFVADAIWKLDWLWLGTFAQGLAELATRVVVARALCEKLVRAGLRGDRAMAEALLVVEIGALTGVWDALVERIVEEPLPPPEAFERSGRATRARRPAPARSHGARPRREATGDAGPEA
jgi:hypothetical protein